MATPAPVAVPTVPTPSNCQADANSLANGDICAMVVAILFILIFGSMGNNTGKNPNGSMPMTAMCLFASAVCCALSCLNALVDYIKQKSKKC